VNGTEPQKRRFLGPLDWERLPEEGKSQPGKHREVRMHHSGSSYEGGRGHFFWWGIHSKGPRDENGGVGQCLGEQKYLQENGLKVWKRPGKEKTTKWWGFGMAIRRHSPEGA